MTHLFPLFNQRDTTWSRSFPSGHGFHHAHSEKNSTSDLGANIVTQLLNLGVSVGITEYYNVLYNFISQVKIWGSYFSEVFMPTTERGTIVLLTVVTHKTKCYIKQSDSFD